MMKNFFKQKKAFSIVELIVSLGIISIIIVIFFNTLITALGITYKNINRSALREEASTVVNLITRDLRNADQVYNCSGTYCEMKIDTQSTIWGICDPETYTESGFVTTLPSDQSSTNLRVCKIIGTELMYVSSSFLKLQSFEFENGFGNLSSLTKTNIVFTMVVEHANASLKINNVVRQTSVSLRNYEI